MIMNLCVAVLLSVLSAPPVDVVSFQGEPRTGEWRGLADGKILLMHAEQEVAIPLAEVLEVKFRSPVGKLDKPTAVVSLWDGSKFGVSQLQLTDKQVRLKSSIFGSLSLAANDVGSLRFSDRFDEDEQWTKLVERQNKSDLLVIRKDQSLDFLDGVVVEVSDMSVKFLLDGEEVSTRRDKVFGLIFARRPNAAKPPSVRLEMNNGDVLLAAAVVGSTDGITVTTPSKANVSVAADQLKRIDFSQGRLRYLTQDAPREVKHVRGLQDGPSHVQDRAFYSPELRPIGTRGFSRGLCIRPQTTLKYRLGGDYRRFQAVVGIDDSVKDGNGDCDLTIFGDGKQLLKMNVTTRDAARPVDLNVEGVVMLEFFVDFGGDANTLMGFGDNLAVADAKLVK